MITNKTLNVTLFILILFLCRLFLGIQINFSHEDYTQVYLIGLENAFSGHWSYWGPDVVWSKTRLPGAMLGLLVGIPLRLTDNQYAPIILSNLISCAGLILLSFYAKRRFPALSLYFLLALFLLSPFMLFNGVVLLNTSYLIFSGALLFVVVAELFLYRNDLLWNVGYYFLALGFSLLFTFQLHLSWVMFLPFVLVLFYLEWARNPKLWWKPLSFFILGCTIASLTLFPTLFTYGSVLLTGSEDNIHVNIQRLSRIFDLFIRYAGVATFDTNQKLNFIELFAAKSWMNGAMVWIIKVFSLFQFIGFCISFYYFKKNDAFRKTALLFFLTMVMALGLYLIGNKHLEMRTYIILYPIPIWLALYAYTYLMDYRHIKSIVYAMLAMVFVTSFGIALANFNDTYSFNSVESKIDKAIQDKDPDAFAIRRKTLMDQYQ